MNICATALWAILFTIPLSALGDACPFEKSAYTDLDDLGFQIQFAPPQGNTVRGVYSATISHPKRGTILELELIYGMGYAEPSLRVLNTNEDAPEPFNIHFFDDNLRSTDLDKLAPPYIFVERLGPADWYGPQADTTARRIPIGTPLWRFNQCKE